MAMLPANLQQLDISWSTVVSVISVLMFFPISKRCIKIYQWAQRLRAIRRAVDKLPGPDRHWFWGNILQVPAPGKRSDSWAKEMNLKYPKYNKFFIGWWRAMVLLRHPDPIKQILKTSQPKALNGCGGYSLIKPWLGDGLLLSSGKRWQRNRKLLTPGFHFDILKPYMTVYNECANVLIDKWSRELSQVDKEDGIPASIEICESVNQCTLDIMLQCAFSYKGDVQTSENRYLKSINTIAKLIHHRGRRPWLYWDVLYFLLPKGREFKQHCEIVHNMAYNLIDSRQRLLQSNPSLNQRKYVDFLDILLLAKDEHGQGLSRDEIRHEVDTFLFAGHDTTASAIMWILYALAKHPDIQDKCRQEVDRVFESSERKFLSWDSLQSIPYLTQCIKEGIRLYSPVPMVMRDLTHPCDIDGYTLLPGTQIAVSIFSVHHNVQIWGDDHAQFKPERFSSDNVQNMDPHAFIPFSSGPRNCIGQNFAMHEIKVLVARILHHFELSVDQDHPVERITMLVARAKHGIKLHLKPRNEVIYSSH